MQCSRGRRWFLILLTLLLNILILVDYKVPFLDDSFGFNGTIPTIPEISTDYQITLYILGALHTFLAFWMVFEYIVVKRPHFVLPEWPHDELGNPCLFGYYEEEIKMFKRYIKEKKRKSVKYEDKKHREKK